MTSSKAILIEDVHGTPFVSVLRCYSKHHFHAQPPASTHGNSNGNTTTSNLPVRSSAHRRADAHSRPPTSRRRVPRPRPRPIFSFTDPSPHANAHAIRNPTNIQPPHATHRKWTADLRHLPDWRTIHALSGRLGTKPTSSTP